MCRHWGRNCSALWAELSLLSSLSLSFSLFVLYTERCVNPSILRNNATVLKNSTTLLILTWHPGLWETTIIHFKQVPCSHSFCRDTENYLNLFYITAKGECEKTCSSHILNIFLWQVTLSGKALESVFWCLRILTFSWKLMDILCYSKNHVTWKVEELKKK